MGFRASDDIGEEMESALSGFMSAIKKKRGQSTVSDFDKLSNKEKKSAYLSTDWDTFVMSQFDSSELSDGHPRVNGLRRVAELLLGDIIQSTPIDVHPVAPRDETQRSTVGYSVTFLWFDGTERTYADVADVHAGNQDPEFVIYSVATAATRAEARAFRKALKLKKCAAEEMGPKTDAKPQTKTPQNVATIEYVSSNQIKFIDKRCKDLDINTLKLMSKDGEQYDVIEDMTKVQAKALIDFLAKVAKDEEVTVDSSLKGYDPNWRD